MADIRRFLDSEYALKRDRAIYEAERRKRDVFEKIPELSRIETEITLTGVRYARSLISDADSANAISEYLEKMGRLNAEKEAIYQNTIYPLIIWNPAFPVQFARTKVIFPKMGHLCRVHAIKNCI